MVDEEITRIRIDFRTVGIIGLMSAIRSLVEEGEVISDADLGAVLMARLSEMNYIPGEAAAAYEEAFVRAYKTYVGEPCYTENPEGLVVKVLGPGCPRCDTLERTIMEVLSELQMPADLEHIRDTKEIAGYGVVGLPALVINGKVRSVGIVPARQHIKKWLRDAC